MEPITVRISITLPLDVYEVLKKEAEAQGRPVSQLAAWWVKQKTQEGAR